ncbi:hypothetical protein DFH29DRAFT_880861 [Suillus ampliporus]|nr:hypothetical protein DFH29DRAFT_880861 [Suillus ampliporus]
MTAWLQHMRLTKALFLGSLWVRLHGNPFKISAVEMCHLITLSFLTALHIDGKTYAQMLQTFDNGKAELRKIVKASLTHLTDFCDKLPDHRKEMITTFVKHFNKDTYELQKVPAKLTGKQDTICNLMTLLYQSMLILLVEFSGKTAITAFKTHVNMNGDIMCMLTAIYLNPMEFAAFTKMTQELPFITSVSSLCYLLLLIMAYIQK